ncbi:ABC transporter ATP-binding protein [Pseudoclavibacter sp. AY1H1]|uniref:ABC transporter ATP-binding protein n=1 Tax=Pseudoclavibacter sp. AY1H1 TaxID=2080584 RepID=UPI000CE74575|nr:ABC transporter ATP-binding protein [Pseudoclavibacter sp. AY1H1]PPF37653.1 ABC transporter ATP-binding protein [Pseudoclavibacter sp. AY1H1]
MSMTVNERTAPSSAGGHQDYLLGIDDVGIRFETKRRSVQALRDVDLHVRKGEFVSIVGPSGCGKSTLLRAVAGLTVPTEGTIELRGSRVISPRQDVGFVFQRPALLPWRDVRGNILLQAEMRGLDKAAASKRCDELLELTSLTDFAKALPHELSGGMQQRVSLCRALLHDPDVLLMDEPFGALDALTREHLNVELQRLWAQTDLTVLLVTHSVPEAVYLASRVVLMGPRPGTIIQEFDVDLPREREYEPTLEDPRFHKVAGRIRELLGSPLGGD